MRNYRRYGGEGAIGFPLATLGLLICFPILGFAQLTLLPAEATHWLDAFMHAHPGRSPVAAVALIAPKIILYMPIHYWLYWAPGAKSAQAQFDSVFLPYMDDHPTTWGLPFTVCLALLTTVLSGLSFRSPGPIFVVNLCLIALVSWRIEVAFRRIQEDPSRVA